MSKSILDITHNHGREMYIIALEHSVRTMEVLPADEALKHLKEKIAIERKELDDERAQQIRRRTPSGV